MWRPACYSGGIWLCGTVANLTVTVWFLFSETSYWVISLRDAIVKVLKTVGIMHYNVSARSGTTFAFGAFAKFVIRFWHLHGICYVDNRYSWYDFSKSRRWHYMVTRTSGVGTPCHRAADSDDQSFTHTGEAPKRADGARRASIYSSRPARNKWCPIVEHSSGCYPPRSRTTPNAL